MASTETGALLSNETTEPVTPSTLRWTQVGFGAAGIAVLISLFTGEDGFFASLIFLALAIALAYLGYRHLIMGKIPADLGLSYVACGMWPLLASFTVISLIWGFLIMFTSTSITRAWNPAWLQNVNAAARNLGNHGELFVDGRPLHHIIGNFSKAMRHHRTYPLHDIGQRSNIALSHATSRIIISLPKVARKTLHAKPLNPFRIHQEDISPSLTFADGTNAKPLIANFLRAIAGVPYSLLVFVGIIYVGGVSFALQALVFTFTLRPLKRPGATVTSVVACSRAIIIGFTALAFVAKNMCNIFIFALFVIYALFELGLCTIISLRMYANEQAVLEPERKPVLIEPVILQFVYSFVPLIGVYIFFKNAVPIMANIIDQVVTPRDGSIAIVKWFIAIPVAFLPQLGLMWYSLYVARKRYNSAVSVL